MFDFNIKSKLAACKWKIKLIKYYVIYNFVISFFKKLREDVVYVWPPFILNKNESNLDKLFIYSKHYLAKLNINIIYYVESTHLTQHTYSPICDKIIKTVNVTNSITKNELKNARYCLQWHIDGAPKATSVFPCIYQIDDKLMSSRDDEWLRLVKDLYLSKHKLPIRSVQFPEHPIKTCAVLGGGPSIEHFYDEQNDFDAWIGCNFLVCDPKLRSAGHPFALCIIDPDIFSPMESMRPLWSGVFELLRHTPAILITAFKFAPFIELYLPEDIKAKCHYVKTLGNDSYRCDTKFNLADMVVTPYGNVLTDLMLPVATAISQEIVIYGCDGRPPGISGNNLKSERFRVYDDNQVSEKKVKYV